MWITYSPLRQVLAVALFVVTSTTVLAWDGAARRSERLRLAVIAALGQEPDDLHYEVAAADLNDDGRKELLVWVPNRDFGGTSGYPLLAFAVENGAYVCRGRFDYAWTPVVVLRAKRSGWRDVAVSVGGGGVPMHFVRWRFDGDAYDGGEDSPPLESPRGRWLFRGRRTETTFGPIPTSAPN